MFENPQIESIVKSYWENHFERLGCEVELDFSRGANLTYLA